MLLEGINWDILRKSQGFGLNIKNTKVTLLFWLTADLLLKMEKQAIKNIYSFDICV